jgi:hypothetical protein
MRQIPAKAYRELADIVGVDALGKSAGSILGAIAEGARANQAKIDGARSPAQRRYFGLGSAMPVRSTARGKLA